MPKKKMTTGAVKIFYNRYFKGKPKMLKLLREANVRGDFLAWVYERYGLDISDVEDAVDLAAARKAMKEGGPLIPWEKIKKDFGLDELDA